MKTKDAPKPGKPSFLELCLHYGVGPDVLEIIADMANVPESVVDTMFTLAPVERSDATKILIAFSSIVRQTWNLTNTFVPLIESETGGQ